MGEHYVTLQNPFTKLVSGLLAETPGLIESLATDET